MKRVKTVKDFMTKQLRTLQPDTPIFRAVEILRATRVTGAPVLDEHGRLAGMLTEKDCMQVILDATYHGMHGGLVRDYMTTETEWVSPDENLVKLAQRFIKQSYHRYPVVDSGRLVGIISRSDMMRAITEYLPR